MLFCFVWKTRLPFASRAPPERPGAAPAGRAAPPRLHRVRARPGSARRGPVRLGTARPGPVRHGPARHGSGVPPPIMQSYKYDKAIPPESKNGGSPALNNNPAKSSSKKALLICLDFLCLVMGERPRGGGPLPSLPPPPLPRGSHLGGKSCGGREERAELGRPPPRFSPNKSDRAERGRRPRRARPGGAPGGRERGAGRGNAAQCGGGGAAVPCGDRLPLLSSAIY